MKLIYKLILGFLAVLLFLGIAGYFAINVSKKALQEAVLRDSETLVVEALDKIDRHIHSRIEAFQDYSRDSLLRETILKSNQEFEKLDNIQAYINKKDQEWTSTAKEEVKPFMQKLLNNRLSKELREKIEFYEEKHGYRIFGGIFVTNKYGANVAQTGKTTDYRQDDEEWWQVTKRDGLYTRDVEYDKSTDSYSTDIGIRIDDENGNFIGAIKIVLNIEEVINIVKELEPSVIHGEHRSMAYDLITKEGKLIYSTQEDKNFFADVSYLLPESGHLLPEPGHIRVSTSGSFISKSDRYSGEVLVTHAHSIGYEDFKGFEWILILRHKPEEIFAPVTKLRNRLLTAFLTLTILGVLIAYFVSISITRNVKRLREATIKIGKGDLDTNIDVKSKDEIGQLAWEFQQMTEVLRVTTVKRDELAKEITERKRLEEKLKALSLTDELTGIYNRRGFFTLTEHLLKIAKRQKRGIFMLYADLDGFKLINDTLGHKEGDNALIDVANILKTNYRESDIIARIGGDEFVVIPVGTTGDRVEIITARLQEKLEIHNAKSNRRYKLSVSVGIAYYNPERPCSIDELLVQADKLMYEQKRHKQKSS